MGERGNDFPEPSGVSIALSRRRVVSCSTRFSARASAAERACFSCVIRFNFRSRASSSNAASISRWSTSILRTVSLREEGEVRRRGKRTRLLEHTRSFDACLLTNRIGGVTTPRGVNHLLHCLELRRKPLRVRARCT
mgnify:CR=1 FL=1